MFAPAGLWKGSWTEVQPEGGAGQQSQGGHVAGRLDTAQPAVEQPFAMHTPEAAAVITQVQVRIPVMPAAIPEDRPVFAEDRPTMPAITW